MKKELISQLMEKYFDGQTSLEEERQLKEYFRGNRIVPEEELYKPVFNFFSEEKEISDRILQQEHFQDLRKSSHRKLRKKTLHILLWTSAVAACALLFFTLNRLFLSPPSEKEIHGHSFAYIDGQKFTGIEIIRAETLNSFENLADESDDIYSLQVEALEIFTDKESNQ
jgi:hypothetical protein